MTFRLAIGQISYVLHDSSRRGVPTAFTRSSKFPEWELKDLFQTHITMQQARDSRMEQEAAHQEVRWKALHHQFSQLQQEVHVRTTPAPNPGLGTSTQYGPTSPPSIRQTSQDFLQSSSSGQPVASPIPHQNVYFSGTKGATPATAVRGKARSAYVHMDIVESLDYQKVKTAILSKYDINSESYRLQFRSSEVGKDENPKELYVRLKELYHKWVQPQNRTKDQIGEVIVLEQFLRMLAPDLQIWIKERDPKTASEAAALADVFLSARQKNQVWTYNQWRGFKEPKTQATMSQVGTKITSEGKSVGDRGGPINQSPSQKFNSRKGVVCHQCGQEGHIKPRCPNNPSANTYLCCVPRPVLTEQRGVPLHYEAVVLNGQEVWALVDTGSMQSLVRTDLVSENLRNSVLKVPIRCIHGDEKRYSTADVHVEVQGQVYLLNVGLVDDLPYSMLLGQDLPVLCDLLPGRRDCNMAETRSMVKKREEDIQYVRALPFFGSDLDDRPGKSRKSKRQRRQDKFNFVANSTEEEPLSEQLKSHFVVLSDIGQLQQDDLEIGPLYREAQRHNSQESTEGHESKLFLQDGVLYRWQGTEAKMVVPQKARDLVLQLGHSVPWAGHLGRHKTIARIGRHFFWPSLRKDVGDFCRSCPKCQYTASRRPPKAPLEPLPVIGIPFEQLGMDVVGPLERSKTGNRYMLVINDYATRYPEVFPLKKVTAKNVALCLVQLFARVGFPRAIVTDQGSNFMSKLLKQVYQLLGIKGIRTTPYHPQTDGLVERFNQTLKQMLRKFVNDTGADWDQWLPYLLFAYREVPQASLGFSPFELLYGRDVRGPLALLEETWKGGHRITGSQSVVSYVLQMRERLESMTQLAHRNLIESQSQQRTWYDKKARARSFQPGAKVLVMLPTDNSKLLAKWQGPFDVIRKLGSTTYEIALPGQSRSKRVLHINLLKAWHERSDTGVEVLMLRRVEDEEEVCEQYLPIPSNVTLDLQHLSLHQQADIQGLCSPEVFKEIPGRTSLVQHDIVLCDGAVPRRRSYRVPERLLTSLKEELDQMLTMNIIEPSRSDWCSPVVLVPKKDGSLRFCVDLRYLNSVSRFDSYPTPRIDELIDRLGQAKWITTIDLCKGYWQVPLTAQSKELTAFRTPWGLYHFSVLPFGLHGAPATFQRLMDLVLSGLSDYAAAYLDDIIVYSASWEQHLQHLKQVFHRIQEAGLTINSSKFALAKKETEYLGYVVGKGVIKPQLQKIEAIQNCSLPETKTQIRSFLGMAGWYRRFVPNFSARVAPLTDLTRKNCPNQICWTEEAMEAFQDIKAAVCEEPVLYCPNFEEPFVLQTDASDIGIGAVLLQGGSDNRHPVAYVSRKLYPREVRYSTVEKECLAVKWALDTFRYYLLGREFTIETDHRPLQWMDRMRDTNARITRWYLSMQPYKFNIQHVPGKSNTTADFLSRLPA
ncbi:gag-pol fusion protein [Pimephales promelas]|nr:gag-pol fusion protein [Pimephales promelas]